MDWTVLKQIAVAESALSRDALHILFGTAGHVFIALVLRRSLAHWLPWLVVLAAELANEYYDLNDGDVWGDRPMWPGSVRDVLVTMAIPTALLMLTRYAPGLFRAEAAKRK